jgi:primosomal protein N' (replication factor Y)
MNLKLALPNGRIAKVSAHFPYEDSPIGYRVLYKQPASSGKTAIVVGMADGGEPMPELLFPDRRPLTSEKHIRALIDVSRAYAMNPWSLLYELLPSAFCWKEEEFVKVSDKKPLSLDRRSLEIISYVSKKRRKLENLEKRFGKGIVQKLIDMGFLVPFKEWAMPDVSLKAYRLAVKTQEALDRVKKSRRREELVRLIGYLSGVVYATEEELRAEGFSVRDVTNLTKRGLLAVMEEAPHWLSVNPNSLLKSERAVLYKTLGKNHLILGEWKGLLERLKHLLEHVLRLGKSALVFCEGVNLIKSLYSELKVFLGNNLLRVSSLESSKELIGRWFTAQEKNSVVLGSRLSLLLPQRDLGLIVCFCESEPKLKGIVDIRNYLFTLAKYHGADFLLFDTLPPMELYVKGDLWDWELSPPTCEVEVLDRESSQVLSERTVELIKNHLKEENLFLVNKVGYGYAYCKRCGYIAQCPVCGSFLTLRVERSEVFCNSCSYKGQALCPECGGPLVELGFGIDKAVDEVFKLFGSRENFHFDTIPRLGRKYDNVFVLHADNILSVPWYDSLERYFSYLWRSACIAERRLVVQTALKDNPVLEHLKNLDWEGFYKEEISRRQEERLPPFTKIIKVRLKTFPRDTFRDLPVDVSLRHTPKGEEALIRFDRKLTKRVLQTLYKLKPLDLQVV